MLIAGLSAIALPGLSTFVSEFLVLVGTFTRHKGLADAGDHWASSSPRSTCCTSTNGSFQGPLSDKVAKFRDVNYREIAAVAPLIALIIFLGVYPKPVLAVINPAIRYTMVDVHRTDPVPALDRGAGRCDEVTRLLSSDPLQTITAPPIAYHALAPVLIVLGAALVGVLAEALAAARTRAFSAQVAITAARPRRRARRGRELLHGTTV